MPVLHWLTKKKDIQRAAAAPLCALRENAHFGAPDAENLLVQGDNLRALKALAPHYAGKVKCVFIDPPYNTGNAFEHYDDNMEHAKWLEMMYPRIAMLREFLADDGSIWVTLDDNEVCYLRIIMDEIFGRKNFIANVIWNSTKSVTSTAIISVAHTNMLLYFKSKEYYVENREEFRLMESGDGFANPDNDPRGPWKADPFQVGGWRPNQQYEITNPKTGKVYRPNVNCSWKNDYKKFKVLMAEGRIVFGKKGTAGPQRKRFLSEAMARGKVATTLWTDAETTTSGTQHSKELFGTGNTFPNPKPEELIRKVLQLATKPGDLVLDSFLGSGTTAAVAHKMGRRWLGVETGEHAKTHCIPRLQKVIDGKDPGGISETENWRGGGGFRFLTIGGEIFDANGDINSELDFMSLAAHLWFNETRRPFAGKTKTPFLGEHKNAGYALLYNGIIGDKSVNGGNIITEKTLAKIRKSAPAAFCGKIIIYANGCRFGAARIKAENIEFRQIPYEWRK